MGVKTERVQKKKKKTHPNCPHKDQNWEDGPEQQQLWRQNPGAGWLWGHCSMAALAVWLSIHPPMEQVFDKGWHFSREHSDKGQNEESRSKVWGNHLD